MYRDNPQSNVRPWSHQLAKLIIVKHDRNKCKHMSTKTDKDFFGDSRYPSGLDDLLVQTGNPYSKSAKVEFPMQGLHGASHSVSCSPIVEQ